VTKQDGSFLRAIRNLIIINCLVVVVLCTTGATAIAASETVTASHGDRDNTVQFYLLDADRPVNTFQELPDIATDLWRPLSNITRFEPDKSYWIKISAPANYQRTQWLIGAGYWHHAQLYKRQQDENGESEWRIVDLSVGVPLSMREIAAPLPLYKIKAKDEPVFWLQLSGFRHGRDSRAQQPFLISENSLYNKQLEINYVQGAYLGFALGLAGFHLILFLWSREKVYLWLVTMATASALFFHSHSGMGLTHLWSEFPWWDEYAPVLLGGAATASYLMFGVTYLRLQKYFAKMHRVLLIAAASLLLSGLLVFVTSYNGLWLQALIQASAALALFVCAVRLAIMGIRYAWYFIAGNLLLLLAIILWSLVELGLITHPGVAPSLMFFTLLASTLQGILLALGLVERMQTMRDEIFARELKEERMSREQSRQKRLLAEAQYETLSARNDALREADELKDKFLAKTSHELNTPLNGIIGFAQILVENEDMLSKEEAREYLKIISSRSEKLKELVADILLFAKARRNEIKLNYESFRLSKIIHELVDSFRYAADKKKLHLNCLIAGNDESKRIFADRKRVRQIVAILVDNAIKYTEQGTIDISLKFYDENVDIVIKDTGKGIDKENLGNIFKGFEQVTKKGEINSGAGLGLSICKKLIELHKGSITAESKLGEGSTFSVTLPA